MKITKEILIYLGADELLGSISSYSGIGWHLKECALEWDDNRRLMCLSFEDSFYNVTTAVSEVEDLKMLYKLMLGEDLR